MTCYSGSMPRLTEQILFLMMFGKRLLPELGEALESPWDYGEILPQGDRAVRRALQRMIARGEIKRIGKGITKGTELNRRHRGYELTEIGKDRALGVWPQMAQEKWDKKWRAVVFDIPERYRGLRAILRRFLKSVGFAGMQKSLWISPFNVTAEVRAFLEASRLDQMTMLMIVAKLWGVEPTKIWKLKEWQSKYMDFGMACGAAPGITNGLKRQFTKLIFSDLWLPEELGGELGRGKAMKLFGRLI